NWLPQPARGEREKRCLSRLGLVAFEEEACAEAPNDSITERGSFGGTNHDPRTRWGAVAASAKEPRSVWPGCLGCRVAGTLRPTAGRGGVRVAGLAAPGDGTRRVPAGAGQRPRC